MRTYLNLHEENEGYLGYFFSQPEKSASLKSGTAHTTHESEVPTDQGLPNIFEFYSAVEPQESKFWWNRAIYKENRYEMRNLRMANGILLTDI